MPDPTDLLKGRSVLITGGLGFIGSNLARRLVACGAKVLLVDSLVPEYGGNLFNIAGIEDRVKVNISDVRDRYSLKYLVRGQDFIFNLAGQTSHLDSMEDPETDLAINCAAQLSILETCRKHCPGVKLVFASTRQIYGKPEYLPVDEEHPLNPVDVNGINKMAAEFYHTLYSNVHGLKACVLRLTNTIGPRMRVRDARQTFVGVWIRQLLEGMPIDVWEGQQLRDFTYVDDVVDAMLAAALSTEGDGKVFNLGGEPAISLRDLAAMMIELNGAGTFNVRTFPADRKKIDIGDYYSDYRRIRAALGWEPRTPLRDAIARTLEFYRANIQHYV
jgi:UDP-glucose 4-epimerase